MMAASAPPESFFPIVEALFQQQRSWAGADDTVAALGAIALQAGFTQETFEAALRNQQLLDRLNAQDDAAPAALRRQLDADALINAQMYRGLPAVGQIATSLTPLLRA